MKVSLVVASGVHQGKVIPIVGTQFLVGRDPQCHLRPASQAVSKQHCAVLIRDGAVYLKDFGSTNGCLLNDVIVRDEERVLKNNDSLKIGPLDFTVRVEPTPAKEDGTPLPEINPETAAAVAAVRAASAKAGSGSASTRDATPAPNLPAKPTPGSKEMPALKAQAKQSPPAAPQPGPEPQAGESEEAENDRLAAMLLGIDDGEVPGGSTVVDVPLTDLAAAADQAKPEEKAAAKKTTPTREDTSNAASEILRKMMRRPR